MCAVKIVPAKKLTIDTAINRTIVESENEDWDEDRDPPVLRLEDILCLGSMKGTRRSGRKNYNNVVYKKQRGVGNDAGRIGCFPPYKKSWD